MCAQRLVRRHRSRRLSAIQKPRGRIHPGVQKVGPEHFGVVSVDCAKARSKWMLCDFYGKVLIPPTVVAHRRPEFQEAVTRLKEAIAQLPRQEHAAEAAPLVEELQAIENRRRRGPQLIGEILPLVLARLGVRGIQCPESGARDPMTARGGKSRERLMSAGRKASGKRGALSDHQRLIRQYGVTPLVYQYGETVIIPTREAAHEPQRED